MKTTRKLRAKWGSKTKVIIHKFSIKPKQVPLFKEPIEVGWYIAGLLFITAMIIIFTR